MSGKVFPQFSWLAQQTSLRFLSSDGGEEYRQGKCYHSKIIHLHGIFRVPKIYLTCHTLNGLKR